MTQTELTDRRSIHVPCPPSQAFEPIRRIGGKTGWYYGNWLWWLRGLVDVMVGGRGLRPGRRDEDQLEQGDPVDCWEVEAVEPDRGLRLAARMKLPGQAWLQFGVEEDGNGSTIWQKAIFVPRGLAGLAYWYVLYPIHMVMFSGMLRSIAGACQSATPPRDAEEPGAQ